MSQEIASVHFAEGCVIERDYLYVAAKADGLDPGEYEFSRMFFNDRGEWIHHDLEWDVRSVCVRRAAEPRQYVAMSLQGELEFQFVGGHHLERIPNAGSRDGAGAMSQIREIGGHLVACGYGGQVYWRSPSGWEPLGAGLAAFGHGGREVHLNGLDGTGLDDLYAVGFRGRIFHFDGHVWAELDSPTPEHLERVRVAEGRVWICGNHGTVLQGDRRGYSPLPIPGFSAHLWDLARFQGRTYVAHLQGLLVHDGRSWSPVDLGLGDSSLPEDGYRLDAADGVLVSFGPKRVALFDGRTWTGFPHPDNG